MTAECDAPRLPDFVVVNKGLFFVDFLLKLPASARALLNAVTAHRNTRARKALSHLYMVHQAELHRVHVQPLRQTIHQDLSAKGKLRVTVTAERAARDMVGKDAQTHERIIRHIILQFTRSGSNDRRCVRGVRTRIQAECRIKELHFAVFVHTDAKIHVRGVAHNGIELFLTRVEQLDWAAHFTRNERRGMLRMQLLTRAKARTDKRLDDVHINFLDPKNLS